MGIVLDIVPNHMATDDANRFWADRAAARAVLRHRRGHRPPPALLRHRPPGRAAPGGPGGLRGHARAGAAAGARGRRRRAADRPPGRARRPRGLPARGCATAASSTSGWRRSSTPASTCATGRSTGTVGYEFLNDACALFVDPAGEAPLTDLWVEVSGDDRRFGELRLRGQARAGADGVRARGRAAGARGARARDRAGARAGLVRRSTAPTSSRGRGAWRTTDRQRDRRGRRCRRSLARVLQLETPGWDAFVTRFQQTTPPVMAKGVEDTAFYRYARLLALNDVGGDPSRFSLRVDDFHAANAERAERFPRNLLVTQTHDTKRSGDVRARIGALAGMADEFAAHVRRWLNVSPLADLRRRAHAGRAVLHLPDAARRVADLRGAARRLPREGDARGQAAHELDRARRAPRGRGPALRARPAHAPRVPARLRALPARRSPRRATAPRSASCCSS